MAQGAFHPSRTTTVAVILLMVSFLLMTLRLTEPVRALRLFIYYLISPSPEALTHLIHSTGEFAQRLGNLAWTNEEKVLFKEKMQRLALLESQLPTLSSENQRLRELLNLKTRSSHQLIAAEVSARDVQNWFDVLWINRGKKEGVQVDSPVLALSENRDLVPCVIGRILECQSNSSKVLLLSDPLSSVSALLSRTGDQALVTGGGGFSVSMDYLDPASDIQAGDEVLSSGMGPVFPPGLLIGYVEKITTTPAGFKRAKIKTSAALSKIREVLVLSPAIGSGG